MRPPLPGRRDVLLGGLLIAGSSLGTLLGFPAQARVDPHPATTALNGPFREWMSQYQVPAASIAMMRDGRLVSTLGFGGMNAETPAPIASLSKAITAICVAHLVDAGRLSFTAPLGSVLGRTFARLGQPVDPRFRSITIEQLLMHRSGLPREVARAARGAPAHDLAGSFTMILATPLDSDPGGDMVYSNIGYITLGMVIQAVTGRDYESYCRDVALRPMNASGTIHPLLRPRASSGGWRVSAIDYARFIQVFEPGSRALGPLGRQWQEARTGNPAYGLGISMRRTEQGPLLTHTGRLIREIRSGSLVVKFPNGVTAVAIFSGDTVQGATNDLRRRLQSAVQSL
ncbi:MAG: beta-lactamase family protein [Xanthobacteraceae bacterium]|nr:beta-lactamase family protein [Xanthobacteraceae bacterium]